MRVAGGGRREIGQLVRRLLLREDHKQRFLDWVRRVFRHLRTRAFSGLAVVGVFCLLLRLTVRDRWPVLSTLFYATPYPLLALAFSVGATSLAWRRRWKRAATIAALGVFSTFLYGATSWYSSPLSGSTSTPELRLLLWNPARAKYGADKVMEHIADSDADIVALVEAGAGAWLENWRTLHPEYTTKRLRGGMVLLVRGQIIETSSSIVSGRYRYNRAEVRVRNHPIRLIVADIHSNPFLSKRPPFEALLELTDTGTSSPSLVVGDFNTPLESVWFNELRRRGYVHAFEAAGHGFAETWPAWIPLLAIDHVWAGPQWQVLECRLETSSASDHKSVLCRLRTNPNN